MRKIRLSIVFDVRPEQETGVENAVKEFIKSSFGVNRIRTHRKEIEVKEHG